MSATSTRNRILQDCAPIVLAALEEAADARIESTEGWCLDCVESPDGLCDTHHEDRDRADEYRRTYDELTAVLGGDAASAASSSPDPVDAG